MMYKHIHDAVNTYIRRCRHIHDAAVNTFTRDAVRKYSGGSRSFPKRPYFRVRDLLAIFMLNIFSYCYKGVLLLRCVLPLSESRGAQRIDRLARFGIDCGLLCKL